jgi:two-component system LytT family response regulator
MTKSEIKVLVVDDELLGRKRIRSLLSKHADIEIVGECVNGREAVEAIQNLKPDLVFLDVQMPKIDGFGVVEIIGAENMPAVIFVTAYNEYAIRAFEINAVDYLLKPFDKKRFEKAVDRAKREIQKGTDKFDGRIERLLAQLKDSSESKYLKRITVKTDTHIFFLPVEEIKWIKASGNYVEVYAYKTIHLIRETIGQVEKKLDPEKFARIHRSAIVNIDFIDKMHPLFSGDHLIVLRDGTKLNMSRTYHKKLI